MLVTTIALFVGAATQVPPPPPRTPLVHGYVYFESGLTRRPPGAIDPIAYLASRAPPGSAFVVMGKTDTIGSAEANMGLSRARALLVADALVRAGVDPSAVKVTWCGETWLNKATADEVAEPLNRFVWFDWFTGQLPGQPYSCMAEPYRP